MSRLTAGITSGILAGAAGATALNVVTYLKQGLAGEAGSTTPGQAAKAVADAAKIPVPGDAETVENRVEAFGPLTGLAVGLGVGAIGGALRAFGVKIPIAAAPVVLGLGAMMISDTAMTALKITSPRSWTPATVLNDALPHLVYGAITTLTLHRMVDPHTVQVR